MAPRPRLLVAALAAAVSLARHAAGARPRPGQPTVHTDCGPVAGARVGGANVFKSIPYAAPPTGTRRWRAPAALPGAGLCWDGALDATSFGASCPQSPGSMPVGATSEDCLFLNVWAPPNAAGLPVMVWIHGGGYVFGSGNYKNYHPTPDQTVAMRTVQVSLNYRLGPFGWLATRELTADSGTGASGNYGYMDMIAALRWVRDNIEAFGGDPGRVTVYVLPHAVRTCAWAGQQHPFPHACRGKPCAQVPPVCNR